MENYNCIKIVDEINESFLNEFKNCAEDYFRLGMARIIAFVLNCFYNDKYKIADLQRYLKDIMESDNGLQNYVFECMKDF